MVAGGVEVLAPFQWEGFRRLGALDPDGIHPFDRDRKGTGMGEGACFWVIEEECSARERGAKILGRIRGWATSTDGHSLVAPEPRGRGLRDAARRALAAARVGPGELSLILAHGTGTPANDKAEAQALLDLLGPDAGGVPVTGIKGATGHCLGASAAMEAAACLSFIRSGRAPPVVGLRTLDPELGITPVHTESREITGVLGLALSAGFGGQNAALVLEGVK
jgi:3-oxoacyl-(acyl-carrier-protein) synthase